MAFGIWSEYSGGFIDCGYHTAEDAEVAMEEMIQGEVDADEDPEDAEEAAEEDYSVKQECPEHEEQPKDGCEECDAEEGEDEPEE
jgi:hypothetical protein